MPTSIPTTIRALIATGDDRLVQVGEAQLPELAPDEALIGVEAFSLNRGEIALLANPRPNWRPGQDVAGRIVRSAADGSGPREGARVVAQASQGGWATQVAVRTESIAELPDNVDTVDAATLGVASVTSLRLLRAAPDIAGRRVLITGASGGVGHALTQLASARGALVTAVTSTPERGSRLIALGAQSVVTSLDDLEGGFDVVFESVGGATFVAALRAAAPNATVFYFGQASGESAVVDLLAALGTAPNARIVIFSYWIGAGPEGPDLATLVRLVSHGVLRPEVGVVDDWSNTSAVLKSLKDREVRGKAVLTVAAG